CIDDRALAKRLRNAGNDLRRRSVRGGWKEQHGKAEKRIAAVEFHSHSLAGTSLPYVGEIGDDRRNLIVSEDRSALVASVNVNQPLNGSIGRHDGVRIEAARINDPLGQFLR